SSARAASASARSWRSRTARRAISMATRGTTTKVTPLPTLPFGPSCARALIAATTPQPTRNPRVSVQTATAYQPQKTATAIATFVCGLANSSRTVKATDANEPTASGCALRTATDAGRTIATGTVSAFGPGVE